MREWPDIGPPAPQRRGLSLQPSGNGFEGIFPKEDFKFKERKKTKKWESFKTAIPVSQDVGERDVLSKPPLWICLIAFFTGVEGGGVGFQK